MHADTRSMMVDAVVRWDDTGEPVEAAAVRTFGGGAPQSNGHGTYTGSNGHGDGAGGPLAARAVAADGTVLSDLIALHSATAHTKLEVLVPAELRADCSRRPSIALGSIRADAKVFDEL